MGQCTAFHPGVFFLTFLSYAMYHIVRKTPSYVQSSLLSEWTPASEHHALGNATSIRHSLFQDQQSAEAFLGILNAIFLFVYAAGNVLSGMAADRTDLRLFLTLGMTLSAVVMFIFGPVLEWTAGYSQTAYIVLQVLNALFQSTGWPCLVPVMVSWFSKQSRGYILGLWSSSSSIGSILGALIVPSVVGYGYEYGFVVTSGMLLSAGVLVFFGLVISPCEVGLVSANDDDRHPGDDGGGLSSMENSRDDLEGETKMLLRKIVSSLKKYAPGVSQNSHKCLYSEETYPGEYRLKDGSLRKFSSRGYQDDETQPSNELTLRSCMPRRNTFTDSVDLSDGEKVDEVDSGSYDGVKTERNKHKFCTNTRKECKSDLTMTSHDHERPIVNSFCSQKDAHDLRHVREEFQSAKSGDLISHSSVTAEEEQEVSKEHYKHKTSCGTPKPVSFLAALLLPGVVPYSLCFTFLKMVVYVFFFWLPFYLSSSFGWAESTADRLSLWYDVGGIVGATVSAFLMSKWNKSALIMTPMIITAIPVLYIYGVLRVGQVITINAFLLFCIGSLLGGVANILSAAVSADLGQQEALRASTKSMATVTGILEGSGTVGAALGQIVVPYLNAFFGWDSVFYFLTMMTCLSAASLLPVLVSEAKDVVRNGWR